MKQSLRQIVPRPALGRIRALQQRRAIKGFAPYVATRSYGGLELRVSIEDPLAQGWYDHDWPRLPEIDLLAERGRLKEGARVFDLGAHQCVLALMLAAEAGPSGSVVAVEATPHNAEVGLRNVALNVGDQGFPGAANVIVCNAVVSSTEGTIPFAPTLNGHVAGGRRTSYAFPSVNLPAVTVDSLVRTYGLPDVVFVDVEGFEQRVLEGATETFAADSHRPDWFVEVHAGGPLEEQAGSVAGVLAHFQDRGYHLLAGNSDEGVHYQPLDAPPPTHRFHLIALG